MRSRAVLLVVLWTLGLPVSSTAEAPALISYQGLLTQPGGLVVPDGSYTLTFRIFEEPEPELGETLWFEQQFVGLQIVNGLYNVVLSSQPGYDLAEAFAGPTRFMELTIDSAPAAVTTPAVLLPRQRIASVPYALTTAEQVEQRPYPEMWHATSTGFVQGNDDELPYPIPGLNVPLDLASPATIYAVGEGVQSTDASNPRCRQFYNLLVDGALVASRRTDSNDDKINTGNWLVQGSLALQPGSHTVEVQVSSETANCFICADGTGVAGPSYGCSLNVQAFYD